MKNDEKLGGKKNMSTETLDNWDGILEKFLKAEDIRGDEGTYQINNVQRLIREGNPFIRLTLSQAQESYIFDLNKTNSAFCQSAGFTPFGLTGCKIVIHKVSGVRNPQTRKEMTGLRIKDIKEV